MARKPIRWSTRCAALTVALLELPHEIAKAKTEKEINAMVELDHFPIRHADGGPDTHWNLRPLFSQDHKLKTKADAKDMAKERKVRKAHARHLAKMKDKDIDTSDIPEATKTWFKRARLVSGPAARTRRWPSRPFPKRRKK